MAPKLKGKTSKANPSKVSVNTLTNIQTSSPGISGEQQVISGPLGTSSGPQTSFMRGYGNPITVPQYTSQGLYHLMNPAAATAAAAASYFNTPTDASSSTSSIINPPNANINEQQQQTHTPDNTAAAAAASNNTQIPQSHTPQLQIPVEQQSTLAIAALITHLQQLSTSQAKPGWERL